MTEKDNIFFVEVKTNLTEIKINNINKIADKNSYKNGGKLFFAGIQPFDYVCLAKTNENVIGFSFLKKSFMSKNDLYILQSAVDNNYANKGVSSAMYDYIYSHSKDFDCITCSALSNDKQTLKFYQSNGFTYLPRKTDFGFYLIKKANKDSLSIDNAKPQAYQFLNLKDFSNDNQGLEK